uniref:BAG family molecular chaperone regulator 6 isoform X1 n=1 Tax=Fragaria vesca subsp. vesca TaxID=101020 RepID=UPI0005CAE25B|nr:PREDICTED: BAG family molecular chaperone regulator 6 isoform X1 [Fragaria vesca subsp. vesca]
MMPMYRYMDSHPEQRNQTFSFPQYPYPPYQPNPPMASMPWPYGVNFGYPNSVPCHSCCNHNAAGYNGFRPSYPQTPMPSPVYFAGGYPAPYHEAFPVHYIPPPHYSMELPKYEYDKAMLGSHHCCGCPNHSHHNANKGVKIEEQESPDVVEKQANESLAPAQMKNYPYPILWIPPEYMKSGERSKLSGPEIVEQKKNPGDERPPASLKSHEEDQRRGLLPFDMDNIKSLMQGGNGERVQDQRSEDKKKENPFPSFWMPSYGNSHDGAGKKDKDMDAYQHKQNGERKSQLPFPFFWFPFENKQKDVGMEEKENEGSKKVDATAMIVPTKQAESSDNGTRVNEGKSAAPGVLERKEKDANQKVIPVKQMELPKKEDDSEDTKRRTREVPVKHVDDNLANKSSGSSAQSQSSSPKKTTKLPPVCLRVDPLPSKKKNGGGSSRSPSPPGHKKVQKETSTDTAKASAPCSLPEKLQQTQQPHDCISNHGKEVAPSKVEKVIEVADKGISEKKDSMHASQIPVDCKEASTKPTVGKAGKDGSKCEFNEDQGTGKSGDTTAQNVEEGKNTTESAKSDAAGSNFQKKRLSDVAAAVLIQSACRGFMVRRWEPLKKLKQIAELREQVNEIRNQITSLESSDLKKNDNQRVAIGETIMRLLLRLDSIQGLLPSVREIRRSLARELVLLQEKLDDITSKKSQDTAEEASIVKTVEEINSNGNTSVYMSEQQVEEAEKVHEEFPAGVSGNSQVDTEPCQGQVTHTMESLPVEVKVPELPEHRELDTASENSPYELPVVSALNSKDLGSELTMNMNDNFTDGQPDAGQAVVADPVVASDAADHEQCGEAPSPAEDKADHSVVSAPELHAIPPESIEELCDVAVDNEPAASEPEKVEPLEMSKCELEQGGEVEITMSPDIASPIATDNVIDEKEAVIQEQADAKLPLGKTAGDSGAVSELKKDEEVRIEKENEISESEEESQGVPLPQQLQEGTMKEGCEVDKGFRVLDPEAEQQHQNDANKDGLLPVVSQTFESQALNLPVETSTHDVWHENGPSELIDGGDTGFLILGDADMPNQDEVRVERSGEESEDYKNLQVVTVEDNTEMQESKAESRDVDKEQSNAADHAKENVLLEKSESLPAPSIATEVSSGDGIVAGVEGARKLIEENEKLRETMQTLMVAGKDQLQVISDLTGRVKDLEKKLAKKKKLRTRRCSRAATSRSSCVKPSSNP